MRLRELRRSSDGCDRGIAYLIYASVGLYVVFVVFMACLVIGGIVAQMD